MTNKTLIIISASSRLKKEPKEPIPAIERYDGVYFRTLRKYIRLGKLRNTDILVVSEKHGLVPSTKGIVYQEPHGGKYGSLSIDPDAVKQLRERNLEQLKKVLNKYSKIYVNVGSLYMRLIYGFDKYAKGQIVYARGGGLGQKTKHMTQWISKQATTNK